MKKLVILSVLPILIAVACTKKTIPTATTTQPAGDKSAQKAVEPNKPDEKAETTILPVQTGSTIPDKPSEDKMGSAVFMTKCTKCHAAKNVGAYTFPQWEVILKKMVPNAKLSADEETQVVAYIKANAKN